MVLKGMREKCGERKVEMVTVRFSNGILSLELHLILWYTNMMLATNLFD